MQEVIIYMDNERSALEQEMSFNDYIWFMWDLKTKAFVTLWNRTINKMHITVVKSDLSPLVCMWVSDFIHEQKSKPYNQCDWEELYNEWCDELGNKVLLSKKSKNGN